MHRLLRIALLAGCLAVSSACQSPPATPSVPAPPETSVKPGINAEYLKPDVDTTQWVERFEREGREIYDHRDQIVRSLRLRSGMAVADIGAGTGLFVPLLAEAVGPKGKVYAVDIVKDFLALIDKRAKDASHTQVRTVLASDRDVQLPVNSIDRAFICDVYHHFEYPGSSLASIHRALKPGGELLLVEFKRIPGTSSDWILKHVRAGQEVFAAEIEQAGFQQLGELTFLKENYILRFRKKS